MKAKYETPSMPLRNYRGDGDTGGVERRREEGGGEGRGLHDVDANALFVPVTSWDPKYARHPGPPSGRLPEVRNVFESRDKAGRALAESAIAPNKIRPVRRRCENVNRSRMCNTVVTNRHSAGSSSDIECYNKLKSRYLLPGKTWKT